MAKGPVYYAKRTSQATTSTSKRVIKNSEKQKQLISKKKKDCQLYRKESKKNKTNHENKDQRTGKDDQMELFLMKSLIIVILMLCVVFSNRIYIERRN